MIVGVCLLALPAIYGEEARTVLSPLSPGIWLSDYFYPAVGACESKEMTVEEVRTRSDLGTLTFFAANILINWIGAYLLILLVEVRNRLRLP